MKPKQLRSQPFLTLTQVLVLLVVVASLIIVLDLNRRAQEGRNIGVNEESLQADVMVETTRQVQLQATLAYVTSEAYVSDYARNEAGYILPGEKRIVPLVLTATPAPPLPGTPTPDPALDAYPWQAWMRLLTDAPFPTR
ncbi:MAG: hypothetical protein KC418_13975 [Anaerolineales bacterium]|nr:hypothetical protein [Anaerolineales bacterium]MCB8952146.1 hypothetical protein [Ardenticatenales bacterium]